jgi:hypothetical protein
MTANPTAFERRLLAAIADADGAAPATLALTLDADLDRVLDAVAALQDRGLLTRSGFDTCRVTDPGLETVAETRAN